MKKISCFDENTFEESKLEFSKFHFDLAENIKQHITIKYDVERQLAKITDIMSNKNGDELIIGVIKNRLNGEINAEKYKITIKKLKTND